MPSSRPRTAAFTSTTVSIGRKSATPSKKNAKTVVCAAPPLSPSQLVRNLFLSTSRSFVRKGVEFTLVPPAEWILGKRRILELYLNVVEWGPGVYGAEAAAQYHYGIPASRVNRDQGARLAAVLPSPLHRKPARMNEYSMLIQERMSRMGW